VHVCVCVRACMRMRLSPFQPYNQLILSHENCTEHYGIGVQQNFLKLVRKIWLKCELVKWAVGLLICTWINPKQTTSLG